MQKLTYINILGESVAFCGAPPFILEKIRGTGPTENNVTAIEGAYQDGDTTYGVRKGRREVDISFHIQGDDRADMYQKRMALCGLLAKDKAFDAARQMRGRIVYQNDHGQYWTWAVPEGHISFDNRIRDWQYSTPLSFRCERPYWSSMAQKMAVLAFSDAGFELPFEFPVAFGSREFRKQLANAGQVQTPVEITIEGMGETPALTNHSTGAKLRLTEPLPAGYILRINTDPAQLAVTVTDPDGAVDNAFGYLDPTGPLTAFTLRPGLNDIEYEPGSAAARSRISIQWYELYEGV